jgi:hypothetical protein
MPGTGSADTAGFVFGRVGGPEVKMNEVSFPRTGNSKGAGNERLADCEWIE